MVKKELSRDRPGKLNAHRSTALDGKHPQAVRELEEVTAEQLSCIFKSSHRTG